jgi:hypothetical protein
MKRIGTRSRGGRGEGSVHIVPGGGLLRANAREKLLRDTTSMSLRVLRAFACASFLFGCTTSGSPQPAQCIPLTAWTSAQQDEMRKEYDALPKDAILRAVFMDWGGMRDADRACMSDGSK